MTTFHRRFSRVLASVLAFLIVSLSAGPECNQALAMALESGQPHEAGRPIDPIKAAGLGLPAPANGLTGPAVPSTPTGQPSSLPQGAPQPVASVPAPVTAQTTPSPQEQPTPAPAPGAIASLRGGAEQLSQARSDDERQSLIEKIFGGLARKSSSAAEPTPAGAPKAAHPSDLKPAPAKEAAKPGKDESEFSPETRKAVLGLFGSRFFGLAATSLSSIAYPLMAVEAVGKGKFYELMSFGGLINIVIALAVGKIADKLPLKKYTLFNFGLRSVLSLANSLCYSMGWLNYWSLLGLTVISSWQFASLFVNDFALMTEIVGKDQRKIRSTEALIRIATIVVTVLSGLFLGKAVVGGLGFFWAFVIVSAIQAIPIFILWKTLPNLGRPKKSAEPAAPTQPWRWGNALLSAVLIAAALGVFFIKIPAAPFLYQSSIPFIAAAALLLWRSHTYQTLIRKHALLKFSLLFVMLGAFIENPLRNSVLGVLAKETSTSEAGEAGLLGSMIAAFYMGQLPTGTGMLDAGLNMTFSGIGPWKLKNPWTFNLKSSMKWVGALGLAAWNYFLLIPKDWLVRLTAGSALGSVFGPAVLTGAGAAAVLLGSIALYLWLHKVVGGISDRAWMRWEAASLVFIGLPLLFWGAPWALFLSLAILGLALNGSARMISATFSSQAKEHVPADKFQYVTGIRGSFFNMASSLGYATYGLATTLPKRYWGQTHSFPFTWEVMTGIFAVFAALFLVGSYVFPFKEKEKKKDAKA